MKCPICKYFDGWDADTLKSVDGNKGNFFAMPIDIKRRQDWNDESKIVNGCPKCGILFMDV